MNERHKHLDLFSGIGGFSIAFESEGFETIAFCEHDEIKRIVLRHWWPGVPILPDVKDIAGIAGFCRMHGPIDLITGGVPCQPASTLGQQRGTSDERWLWPETIGVVGAVRPRFAVFENPPAILTLEGGRAWNGIVSGLVALGYDLWWDVFPAAAFGAGHLRERVLLVCADAGSEHVRCENRNTGSKGSKDWKGDETSGVCNLESVIADSVSERRAETRDRLPVRESPKDSRLGRGRSGNDDFQERQQPATHTNCPRLQGHSGDENRGGGGQDEKRPTATADLRGRVFATEPAEPAWWNEAHTGVPVLAYGIPNKLAEAAARCTGDAVVPQVLAPIAKAIRETLK